MQNAALAALGLSDWTYGLLPVPPELFAETVRALPGAGFLGANVTIPHKAAALALATEATGRARAIGAANTLTFGDGAAIHADNTDAPGLVAALGDDLAGRTALVLGAGGTARAAVWALRDAGVAVRLWNRTPERGRAVAEELGAEAVERAEPADVLVNASAAGLADGASFKGLPIGADDLDGYPMVVDFVYRSSATDLALAARAHGAALVDGRELLVRQGALSLEGWTGRPAPVDVMREAV
jgi:shikimate dehydrogenase